MAASLKLTELNSVASGSLGDSDILLVTDINADESKSITKAAIAGSIKVKQFQDVSVTGNENSAQHSLFHQRLMYDASAEVWRFPTDDEVIMQAQVNDWILWVENVNVGVTA